MYKHTHTAKRQPTLSITLKSFIVLTALSLAACSTPPPVKNTMPYIGNGNDCLPQAAAMTENLKKAGIKADVLSMNGLKYGHAVCRYIYPVGSNQVWMWDSTWGSVNFPVAYKDDAQLCAEAWTKWLGTGLRVNGEWLSPLQHEQEVKYRAIRNASYAKYRAAARAASRKQSQSHDRLGS